MKIGAPSAGRLESIVLVKVAYYASSTARFSSKLCSFFKIVLLFFNVFHPNYARQKIGISVRKVSFIDL